MRFTKVIAVAVAVVWSAGAGAQAWPTKPVRVVVPFTAGSATDILARTYGQKLQEYWGQSVIVDNRPGAGGTIGTGIVAKSPPDGYTLLVHSAAYAVNPSIYPDLPFDTLKDFVELAPLGGQPNVLVVAPSSGIKSVADLIAQAKAKPGTFNYASVGVGSGTHLSAEKLKLGAGFDAVHIPFRGGPEALTEIIAGRVDFYFCPINTALPLIRQGTLVALVTNGTARAPELPEVPTTLEAGYRNADFPIWIGMLAPVQTPRSIVDRLNAETIKAIQVPATQEKLAKAGILPLIMTPSEFDTRIKAEIASNIAIATAAGIKPN